MAIGMIQLDPEAPAGQDVALTIWALDPLGDASPNRLILGPIPCQTCRVVVEWRGVNWLDAGTLDRHRCFPPQIPEHRPRA